MDSVVLLPTDLADFAEEAIGICRGKLAAEVRHERAAKAMRRLVRCPNLLSAEQLIPTGGDRYRTVPLWTDSALDLSLLALVWNLGQSTPIHDHPALTSAGASATRHW